MPILPPPTTTATDADALGPGLSTHDAAWNTAQAAAIITDGLSATSAQVNRLAAAVADLVDTPITSELGAAAVLADDLVALARLTQVLTVEVARRASAAHTGDITATGVRATLHTTGWTAAAVNRTLRLGRFTTAYPDVAAAIRGGCLSTDAALAIDTTTRTLPADQRHQVITWILSWAPRLDTTAIKVAVTAAVDTLRPSDADDQAQHDYDDRALTFTRFRNMVLFQGRLPALEGEAFIAAVTAYAERQRGTGGPSTSSGTGGASGPSTSSGTGGKAAGAGGGPSTSSGTGGGAAGAGGGPSTGSGTASGAQRAADGLTALVADAVATGTVPTLAGATATVSVLIPITEADRVAHGHPRNPAPLPDLTRFTNDRANARPIGAGLVAGHHTLADSAARFLLCDADLSGVLVHTASPVGGLLGAAPLQPLALGRTRRFATRGQRQALTVRDRGCVIPGCDTPPTRCQTHHVTDWAHGGNTDLDDLALLCVVHHRQVDLNRWHLTRNPDPTGPHWTITPTPRAAWRPRT